MAATREASRTGAAYCLDMEPDLVEVHVDDTPQESAPRLGRHLLVAAAALALGAIAVAGRAVSEPEPQPTQVERSLVGATGSLAAPWAESWRTAGDVISVGGAVLVSAADGTGVRALTAGGDTLWGPVAGGSHCAASGAGAVCLTVPTTGGVATAVAPDGALRARLDAPAGIVDWWVVDGDVVTVAVQGEAVTAQRWAPPGHRGVSWTWQGTAHVAPEAEHGRTWLRVGDVVVDLSTGRTIASPADAVALPAWRSVLGPNDGSSAVPIITDGSDVVVAGRYLPGPAHLLVQGVVVTGTGEVTARRTADGVELWRAAASAAFSDGVAVGLIAEDAGRARVSARDLVSGAELWSVAVGDATYAGTTTAGVVLQTRSGVVAWGP